MLNLYNLLQSKLGEEEDFEYFQNESNNINNRNQYKHQNKPTSHNN